MKAKVSKHAVKVANQAFANAYKEETAYPQKTNKPNDWGIIYDRIKEYRKANKAPVDDMGCERNSVKNTISDKQYRFQVLVSLMLSSQTRDPITAEAVENLVKFIDHCLEPSKILEMSHEDLIKCINKVGFYNVKAKNLRKTCELLLEKYNGDIPTNLKGLLSLPGIGSKMAYLTLQCALNQNEGIGVDTHVHRITNRLGWVSTKTAEQTRLSLQSWLPKDNWREINFLLVGFGQTVCKKTPRCASCPVNRLCISSSVKHKCNITNRD